MDRVTHDLSISDGFTVPIDRVTKSEEIYGILGVVDLISGPHLAVVKRRRKVRETVLSQQGWRPKCIITFFPHNTEQRSKQGAVRC